MSRLLSKNEFMIPVQAEPAIDRDRFFIDVSKKFLPDMLKRGENESGGRYCSRSGVFTTLAEVYQAETKIEERAHVKLTLGPIIASEANI